MKIIKLFFLLTIVLIMCIAINSCGLIADVYYKKGLDKIEEQDYEGAYSDLTKAIKFKPDFVDAYYARGLINTLLSEYKEAILDFNEVIELNPNWGEAYYCRGQAKHFQGDETGACKDWHKAIDLNYNDAIDNIKAYCE